MKDRFAAILCALSLAICLATCALAILNRSAVWMDHGVLWAMGSQDGWLFIIRNANWPYRTVMLKGGYDTGGYEITFPFLLLAVPLGIFPWLRWVRPLLARRSRTAGADMQP